MKNIAKEVYSTRVKNAIDVLLQQQQELVEKIKPVEVSSVNTQTTLKEKQKSNYSAILERVRDTTR